MRRDPLVALWLDLTGYVRAIRDADGLWLTAIGDPEEARAALAECERLRPGLLGQRAGWRPYPDVASNDHFFAGLRRLGLID